MAQTGLARDLNHQVPAYRHMARITLADWTCSLNNCIHPFHGIGFRASTTHKQRILPRSWLTAHDAMRTLEPQLSILPTDLSYIYNGDTHIKHISVIYPKLQRLRLYLRLWTSLSRGSRTCFFISFRIDGRVTFRTFFPRPPSIPAASTAAQHWSALTGALAFLTDALVASPRADILLPRATRRQQAERLIRDICSQQALSPAAYDGGAVRNWASDESMNTAAAARHERVQTDCEVPQ